MVISGLYTLSASLIWGVNTLFLLEAGLNIQGVFIANAAFTAGMALFEIPTGVIADTVGRRISLLLNVAVLILTTYGYIIVARSVRQIADSSIKYGWKQRPVRLLMIVGFIQAVFSTWAFYA